jgi:hypothetical protein
VDPGEVFGSPEGVAFMKASSDAWRDADIAAGTPAEVATPAADRTFAAFTATE